MLEPGGRELRNIKTDLAKLQLMLQKWFDLVVIPRNPEKRAKTLEFKFPYLTHLPSPSRLPEPSKSAARDIAQRFISVTRRVLPRLHFAYRKNTRYSRSPHTHAVRAKLLDFQSRFAVFLSHDA